jgi:hypothetical protein
MQPMQQTAGPLPTAQPKPAPTPPELARKLKRVDARVGIAIVCNTVKKISESIADHHDCIVATSK